MNELRRDEAIMALHELNYSPERIAELIRISTHSVISRIKKSREDPTVQTLQEEVIYWRRHAEHYKQLLVQQRTIQAAPNG